MQFPRSPRKASLPRLRKRTRRAANSAGLAVLLGLVGTTAAIALPELAHGLTTGTVTLPTTIEPWRAVLAIVFSAAAAATVAYRTPPKGGPDA